jgi:hypothetical protein
VNRAVAARDLAVARMRLALLKDLPLSASGAAGGSGFSIGAGAATMLSAPPATTQPRTPSTGATAGSASGSNQQ